jgi:hypothetical protein
LSTGIIATAVVLIITYIIRPKIVGFALRLVVPLVLLMLLGGAGVFSGLMQESALLRTRTPPTIRTSIALIPTSVTSAGATLPAWLSIRSARCRRAAFPRTRPQDSFRTEVWAPEFTYREAWGGLRRPFLPGRESRSFGGKAPRRGRATGQCTAHQACQTRTGPRSDGKPLPPGRPH